MIFGWDASDYDHSRGLRPAHIAAAVAEGIAFFVHKATEQTASAVHRHRGFATAVGAARDAGIPFLGAYVVARTGVPGEVQAATAVSFVTSEAPFLDAHPGFFWQVDLEHWEYDKVDAAVGEGLASALEAATGRRAVLYAPRWSYGDGIPGTRPLWNSDYRGSGAPAPFREQWARVLACAANEGFAPMSGRIPRILQYASDATIGGQPTCDANVFPGTVADFGAMIGAPS